MAHHYSEFSLNVRWGAPASGSYPRPQIPGYYLTLGWSNEGEANWLINSHRLTWGELSDIVNGIGVALGVNLGPVHQMQGQYEKGQRERLESFRAQKAQLEAKIKALESEDLNGLDN